jgi:hypothetical protein
LTASSFATRIDLRTMRSSPSNGYSMVSTYGS